MADTARPRPCKYSTDVSLLLLLSLEGTGGAVKDFQKDLQGPI